ncbi:MAG: Nif3-like dinuclear metal center hexameric protein [Thermotogota bacterium]
MSEATSTRDIIRAIEEVFPPKLAMESDRCGLQVGPFDGSCERVLVTLDVTEGVVEKAKEKGCRFILSHHPLLYLPCHTIDRETALGRILTEVISSEITVYASHTPADIAPGGLNDYWAEKLGLRDVKPILKTYQEKLYKFQVFVPKTHAQIVRNAMFSKGAGAIGKYADCTFSSEGIGTFRPLEGAQPFIGQLNGLERVEEMKIETLVEGHRLSDFIETVLRAHPYEEVAYDLMEETEFLSNRRTYGLGRYGTVEKRAFRSFVEEFKEITRSTSIQLIGDLDDPISTVGFCSGSGRLLIPSLPAHLDLYISGDLSYHDLLGLKEKGIKVILFPHFESERVFPSVVRHLLGERIPELYEYVDPVYTL